MTLRAMLTMLLLTQAYVALATDVPVHYLLDERAIRTSDAASMVTIGLFTDPGCTVGVLETTLPLANIDVLARVSVTALRGTPKSAKIAELRHVLHGVPAVAPLYMRVVGAGVAPIGKVCQVQSVPAAPANMPVLVDATGTVLGPYGVSSDSSGRPAWIRSSGDLTYTVSVDPTELYGSDWELYFEAPDCSSSPLMVAEWYSLELFYGSVSHGSTLYYPIGSPSQRLVTARSYYAATPAKCGGGDVFAPPDHCCHAFTPTPTSSALYIETATTDLGQFVPPFHAELR